MSEIKKNNTAIVALKDDVVVKTTVKTVLRDRVMLTLDRSFLKDKPSIQEGARVKVAIYTSSGIIVSESFILTVLPPNDFVIDIDYIAKKIQRREFIRAPYISKIFIHRSKDEDIEGGISKIFVGETINIGGNSILFESEENFEINEILNITTQLLGASENVKFTATVFRKEKSKSKENAQRYVIIFQEISTVVRDKIIKLCLLIDSEKNRPI